MENPLKHAFGEKNCGKRETAEKKQMEEHYYKWLAWFESRNMPDNLCFAVMCGLIHRGLEKKTTDFPNNYPKTMLGIIDTLKRFRLQGQRRKTGMYGNDYNDISSIKRITYICVGWRRAMIRLTRFWVLPEL